MGRFGHGGSHFAVSFFANGARAACQDFRFNALFPWDVEHYRHARGFVALVECVTHGVVKHAGALGHASTATAYTWLPSGRSASEYQYRTSSDGVTWSAWASIPTIAYIATAYANAYGGAGVSDSVTVYVQLGAQGTALTGVAAFDASAYAVGRS